MYIFFTCMDATKDAGKDEFRIIRRHVFIFFTQDAIISPPRQPCMSTDCIIYKVKGLFGNTMNVFRILSN